MFDLNIIEQDWLENYRALTEEEILNIFREDYATIPQYEESMKEWMEKTKVNIPELSAEERLMRAIYGEPFENENLKKQRERMWKLKEIKLAKYPEPQKHHLSEKNQKRIVEGSMNLVFEYVRYYYSLFQSKISEETLYYLLLETLIKIPKYMIHYGNCRKSVFAFYVGASFDNAIINYIYKIEKISYSEAHEIMDCYKRNQIGDNSLKIKTTLNDHNFKNENYEMPIRPSDIKFLMKNQESSDDIMLKLNTEDFFKIYNDILNNLSEEEKIIMQLSYDSNGYPGLTYEEISDYLGIGKKQVGNIKRRALKHIRQNDILKSYKL